MKYYGSVISDVWNACAVPGSLEIEMMPDSLGKSLLRITIHYVVAGERRSRYRQVETMADRLIVVRNLATETVLLAETIRRELVAG